MKLPLWRRRQGEQLDEEIAGHLRLAAEDRVARGESAEEAARAARREFGNVDLVKETTRDMWGWMSLDRLWQDVRYACRTLRRSPGFTTVALLTLALGIGANTAVFTVVNAVVLRPLPFPHSERLVSLGEMDMRLSLAAPKAEDSASYPNFFDWRERNHVFEQVAAYRQSRLTITGDRAPRELSGTVVSSEFFRTLGVQPSMGRDFRRAEEAAGSDVAIIGHELWTSRFGADPGVIGRKVTLNGRLFTIVGVMPARFRFPIAFPSVQLWTTIAEDARKDSPDDTPMTAQRGAAFMRVIGRMKPGVSLEQARSAMNVIARAMARQYPDVDGTRGAVEVTPVLQKIVGDTRYDLLVLLAAVGCLLLIACTNIANLLLARGVGRSRELSVRTALGAAGGRLVRQLLTESLVLASLGAALGVGLAYSSIGLLVRLSPVDLRGLDEVAVDGRVIGFVAVMTVVTALLFGAIPAARARKPDLTTALKEGQRSGAGRRQHRLRDVLVVAETALGVVLLVGAGLMLRSFEGLVHASPGFEPQKVMTTRFRLPDSKYSYEKQVRFYDDLFPTLAALPGVEAVGGVAPLPLSGDDLNLSFDVEGRPTRPSDGPSAQFATVSPGYFRAMKIPVLRGRDFSAADRLDPDVPRAAIINQEFARQYFPGEDPIGKRIRPGLRSNERETPWRQIVGVVGDVKLERLSEKPVPAYYIPYAQGLLMTLHLTVRTALPPSSMIAAIRKTIAARDPELAVADERTMDQYMDHAIAGTRFEAVLLSLFAALGLVLTAIGLYGVTANAVAERTHEFGVRMALGATSGTVLGGVLRRGLALTGTGLAAGMIAAALVSRVLQAALYNVRPFDPLTFAAVAGLLLVVAVVACWIPARRATSVDPIRALRCE